MIHKDFYERGRYVAYNRDVRYSPTHSELSDQTRLDCRARARDSLAAALPRYQATASQGPAWPALVTVATC